jgi:hypothetical protein
VTHNHGHLARLMAWWNQRLGDRGYGSYASRVRAWARQAEPRDRLTSRDYSPIPAVALSPPKLQMRNVAEALAGREAA